MQGKGIIRIGKGTNVLYLPHKWIRHYKWKTGEEVQLHAGKRTVTAYIRMSKGRQLALSRNLYEELKLFSFPISWTTEGYHIRFGPFVGAYCLYTDQPDKPFADNTTLFQDMTFIAHELYTPFYIITPGGFHAHTQTVTGWLFNVIDKQWKQTELPWPELCIKKHIHVPARFRPKIQEDEGLIRLSGCQLLTPSIGSKWDVHQQLLKNSVIASALPNTRKIGSIQDLQSMLKRYSTIYVKPVNGTQGKGIYRFTKLQDRIKVQYQTNDQTKSKFITLIKQKNWFHRTFIVKGNYLAQQAILLLSNEKGLPADFRWLIQKDGSGSWQITARVARIAGEGNITTNISTGGNVVNAGVFLKSCGFRKERLTSCIRKLDVLALQIAQELETTFGTMGEIGIDFGVDKSGKPWVIEVNTRPGRKMLRILDSEVRELSLRRPLEYARYTIGFEES